jgi:hypothetical protein
METKLSDLGFTVGINCEAIVTTLNPDGSSNAAPMGMTMQDEQHLKLNIFNTSSTCRNLKANKCGVVNLTGDIQVYYGATFKEANPDGKLPSDWFIKSEIVQAPKLRAADATIEISVNGTSESGERTQFNCKIERVAAKQSFPQVYCRALPLTVEAITHATRVKAFIGAPEKQQMVAQLIETIQSHARIVERVAPNSQYSVVFADLQKRIDLWRSKQ